MNAERIDFFTNQLRGVPVRDLGRKMREILREATAEAEREEREACAEILDRIATEGNFDPEGLRVLRGAIEAIRERGQQCSAG